MQIETNTNISYQRESSTVAMYISGVDKVLLQIKICPISFFHHIKY